MHITMQLAKPGTSILDSLRSKFLEFLLFGSFYRRVLFVIQTKRRRKYVLALSSIGCCTIALSAIVASVFERLFPLIRLSLLDVSDEIQP